MSYIHQDAPAWADALARHITIIIQQENKAIMATIQDLQNAVATLVTDTTTALADLKAALLKIPTTDPATQAAIDDAVSKLDTLDTSVKAADPGPQS